jgi:hypothetical protein
VTFVESPEAREARLDQAAAAEATDPCYLRPRWRLVWRDKTWYGYFTRRVVLRVWHDGSVTVEEEEDR